MIEVRWAERIRYSMFDGSFYYVPMMSKHLYSHTVIRLSVKSDFTIIDSLGLAIL